MTTLNEWTLNGMRQQSIRMILRQLEHRFGTVPQNLRDAVENLPLPALEELAIAVLDFGEFEDAELWIRQHKE